MNKDLTFFLKEFNVNTDKLPMDFFTSEEVLHESKDVQESNNILLNSKNIALKRYNFFSSKIKIPMKPISRILNPNKIL